MSTVDITKVMELKKGLIDAYQALLSKSKGITHPVGMAYCNAKLEAWAFDIQALENLIKGEENTMITMKDKLVTQVVRLDEIQNTRKVSELSNRILEDAEELQKLVDEEMALARREKRTPRLPALKIDHTKVRYNNYQGKISSLKKEGKLSDEIRVIKSGENFYLAIKK